MKVKQRSKRVIIEQCNVKQETKKTPLLARMTHQRKKKKKKQKQHILSWPPFFVFFFFLKRGKKKGGYGMQK